MWGLLRLAPIIHTYRDACGLCLVGVNTFGSAISSSSEELEIMIGLDIFVRKFKSTTVTVSRLCGLAEKYPKLVTITTRCSKSQQLINDTSDRSPFIAPVAKRCEGHATASELGQVDSRDELSYFSPFHISFHIPFHIPF